MVAIVLCAIMFLLFGPHCLSKSGLKPLEMYAVVSDILVLSYKERCRESTLDHVDYLFDPSSTWNAGRNLLFVRTMNRSGKLSILYFNG